MVKKAAEKTAGIDMSGFVPRAKVVDGQPLINEHHRNATGFGIVSEALTGSSKISKELANTKDELDSTKAKLAEFDGAILVKSLDPKLIRRSEWANRNEAEFKTSEFEELRDEIEKAEGNVQPIKVRLVDGQPDAYEIVFGHRRHQACLELELMVNAVVVEKMEEKELFKAMDRENRSRKNLSAWEQGQMYARAIEKKLYGKFDRDLERALGLNHSDFVRALQLAKLPQGVVDAFATPLDLQFRWAKPLTDAYKDNPNTVLARSKEIQKDRGQMSATEVFARLVGKDQKTVSKEIQILAAGKKAATFRTGPKGRAVIEFEADAMPKSKHAALAKLIEGFLKNL